jgi:hypothetical protein
MSQTTKAETPSSGQNPARMVFEIVKSNPERAFNVGVWVALGAALAATCVAGALALTQKSPADAYPAIVVEKTACLRWESERSGKVGSTDVCKLWAAPQAFAALRATAMEQKPAVADDQTACLQWRVTRSAQISSTKACELWARPSAFASLMASATPNRP